jgi:hypothetical protein
VTTRREFLGTLAGGLLGVGKALIPHFRFES